MDMPDFLNRDGHDEITLRGTRIGLYHFLHDYNQGESAESLALQFPHVPLATVHKVIAFYLENKVEMDRYLKLYADDIEEQRANGKHVNLAELRKRLASKPATTTVG